MASKKNPTPSANNSISINGDVRDSAVFIGDNNTVNQTIIQKFFNIFKSDAETLEQRNRRILLGHVENAWIKGVLDASLHGAALLDLGIKQDPEAVTKYPWAIQKESTKETLPAGTPMLEIFDSIGMGRSLLILGAPGSGKTTMLLELARGLITRAREDITQPIPMVFNLASWTEKLTLADWLAQELNNLYSVPRKTAPNWVKGDKLLLLLDGLDEVRQESRAKCVEAINAFRKEHGLTSLAVCSRSQDYADLNAKLSFEGAIEVQPLTQKQITKFFNRFGDEMAGIKQVLKIDSALLEMAETPLFLSSMLMAYRGKQDVDILTSKDENAQRKHLFDTYIERMFERPRTKNVPFKQQDILCWLSWLAGKMIEHNEIPYLLENMQPKWLSQNDLNKYKITFGIVFLILWSLLYTPITGSLLTQIVELTNLTIDAIMNVFVRITVMIEGLIFIWVYSRLLKIDIVDTLVPEMADTFVWNWEKLISSPSIKLLIRLIAGLSVGLVLGLIVGPPIGLFFGKLIGQIAGLVVGTNLGLLIGLRNKPNAQTTYPEQGISFSIKNFVFIFGVIGPMCGLVSVINIWLYSEVYGGLLAGLIVSLEGNLFPWLYLGVTAGMLAGLIGGLRLGGLAIIQYYAFRFILTRNNLLPWRLVPFLDHCVDLIFLRRVGGGYIFIHRLLMEHFAEMYVESPTSKGN